MRKLIMILSLLLSINLTADAASVLTFAGSLRKDSVNKKLVLEAAEMARQMDCKVTSIDLKDYPMPFYDGDLESQSGKPESAKAFTQLIADHDIIIIASPSYNGSFPGVLKNAIDWATRGNQGGESGVFKGKTFVIMSASPGSGGGAAGLKDLRSLIEYIGGSVVKGQLVVPNAYNAFNAKGELKDPQLRSQLYQLIEAAVK